MAQAAVPTADPLQMECKHGLMPAFCSSCVDSGPTWVFRAVGGTAYHARQDCEWLGWGHPRVHRRGLTDNPIEKITRAEAEAYLYQPCATCSSDHRLDRTDADLLVRGA